MKHSETLEQFLLRSSNVLFPDQTRAPKRLTVHSRSSEGDTPLHVAALGGDRRGSVRKGRFLSGMFSGWAQHGLDSIVRMEGYRTEYAGLHLVARRKNDSFEFTVFDGSSVVWQATARDMEAAKGGAIFEAREWLGHPSVPLPAWEPITDEISARECP
jgi:hypothetical protein